MERDNWKNYVTYYMRLDATTQDTLNTLESLRPMSGYSHCTDRFMRIGAWLSDSYVLGLLTRKEYYSIVSELRENM